MTALHISNISKFGSFGSHGIARHTPWPTFVVQQIFELTSSISQRFSGHSTYICEPSTSYPSHHTSVALSRESTSYAVCFLSCCHCLSLFCVIQLFFVACTSLIQLLVCLALLIDNIGPSALAGFALVVLSVRVMRRYFTSTVETTKWTDKQP